MKKLNLTHGFTLIELGIVIIIVTSIMSIILFNYGKFNDDFAISSAAQEMAIAIRQAQTFGLNVKETKVSSNVFSSAYGIYFNPNNSASDYYIFADNDGDKFYDVGSGCGGTPTECIERVTLRNGVTITSICRVSGASDVCPPNGVTQSMNVTFLRPNPDADINFFNSSGSSTFASEPYGKVRLTSKKGKVITVIIEKTGQIYIQ